ncbi:MAG: phenylalanine--tRNA ligase subunit alpha [Staphylothermus sp.]|nr:phenylalanine--tRNA ligase subunit alpha [Staphylothermus sp.]
MAVEKVYLPTRQYRIVEVLAKDKSIDIVELAKKLNVKPEDIMRDLAELESLGLLRVERRIIQEPIITEEGMIVLQKGLPEERVYRVIHRCINEKINEFMKCVSNEAEMDPIHVKIGLQHLIRNNCLRIENRIVKINDDQGCFKALEEAAYIKAALKEVSEGKPVNDSLLSMLKRRKMVKTEKKKKLIINASPKLLELYDRGLIVEKELATVVYPKMAEELDKYIIKEFDLSISPPRLKAARLNAYMEFLDLVREILVSMGFEEVKGPHVELEFWNFDALFQAQDHPAREIHDTFFLKTEYKGKVLEELLERAKKIHEKGWNYQWNPLRALRPILRSQTTAVSVRTIYERGEGEYRVFSLDRVFRPETLDAKHAMEFYQLDGIIVGRNVNFKHLLAFFKEFAAALGIKEVWFKPGYFPFTEPSVEGFIKHPELGWIEVFPGGVFRPEVMEILGAPGIRAIAWGIGIDRLAMSVLGLNDIRDLFNKDLDFLRKMPSPKLPYFLTRTNSREVRVVKIPR